MRSTEIGLLCKLSKADCNGVDWTRMGCKRYTTSVLRNRHLGGLNMGWDLDGSS
jgi:hypothetical protein